MTKNGQFAEQERYIGVTGSPRLSHLRLCLLQPVRREAFTDPLKAMEGVLGDTDHTDTAVGGAEEDVEHQEAKDRVCGKSTSVSL